MENIYANPHAYAEREKTPEEVQEDAAEAAKVEGFRAKAREQGALNAFLQAATSSLTWSASDLAQMGVAAAKGGAEGAADFARLQQARELEYPTATKIGEFGVPIIKALATGGVSLLADIPAGVERLAVRQAARSAARTASKKTLEELSKTAPQAVLGSTMRQAAQAAEKAAAEAAAKKVEELALKRAAQEAAKQATKPGVVGKAVSAASKAAEKAYGASVFGVTEKANRFVEEKVVKRFIKKGASEAEKSAIKSLAKDLAVKVPVRAATVGVIDMPLFTLQHGVREAVLSRDPQTVGESLASNLKLSVLEGAKFGGYFGLAEAVLPRALKVAKGAWGIAAEKMPIFGREAKRKLWTQAGAEQETGVVTSTADWMFENKERLDTVARAWPEQQHGRFFDVIRDLEPSDAEFFTRNHDLIVEAANNFVGNQSTMFVNTLRKLPELQRVWMIENAPKLAEVSAQRRGLWLAIASTFDKDHGSFSVDAANELLNVAKNAAAPIGGVDEIATKLYATKKAQIEATRDMLKTAYSRLAEDDSIVLGSIGEPGGPPDSKTIIDFSYDLAQDIKALVSSAKNSKLRHAKSVISSLESALKDYEDGLQKVIGGDYRVVVEPPSPELEIMSQLSRQREAYERGVRKVIFEKDGMVIEPPKPEPDVVSQLGQGREGVVVEPPKPQPSSMSQLGQGREGYERWAAERAAQRIAEEIEAPLARVDQPLSPTEAYLEREAAFKEARGYVPGPLKFRVGMTRAQREQIKQANLRRSEMFERMGALVQLRQGAMSPDKLKIVLEESGITGAEADQFVSDLIRKNMARAYERGTSVKQTPVEQAIDEVLKARTSGVEPVTPSWAAALEPTRVRTPSWSDPATWTDPARFKQATAEAESKFQAVVDSFKPSESPTFADQAESYLLAEARRQSDEMINAAYSRLPKVPQLTPQQIVKISELQRGLRSAIGETVSQGRLAEFGAKPKFQSRYTRANGVARAAYGAAREVIQSREVWGEAGAMRGEVDNVYSEFMNEIGQSGSFRAAFMRKGVRGGKDKAVQSSVSLKRVRSYVKSMSKQLALKADQAAQSELAPIEQLLGRQLMTQKEAASVDSWNNINNIMRNAIDVVDRRLPDLVSAPRSLKGKTKLASYVSDLNQTKQFLNKLRQLNDRALEQNLSAEKKMADTQMVKELIQKTKQQIDPEFSPQIMEGAIGDPLKQVSLASAVTPFGFGPMAKIGLGVRLANKVGQMVKARWQVAPQLRAMVEADLRADLVFKTIDRSLSGMIDLFKTYSIMERVRSGDVAAEATPQVSQEDRELYEEQQQVREGIDLDDEDEGKSPQQQNEQPKTQDQLLYEEQERLKKELELEDEQEHTLNILNRARSISTDPSILMENMNDAGSEVMGVIPESFAAATETVSRIAKEIAMIAPERPIGMLDAETLTTDQIARISRVSELASNPQIVINSIADGSLTQSDVDSVARMYPQLTQQMRFAVYSKLQDAQSQKIDIPFQSKIAAERFLGLAISTETSASVARAAQSVYSRGRPNGPGRPRETMTPAMVANRSSGRVYGASNLGIANRLLTDKQRSESRNA